MTVSNKVEINCKTFSETISLLNEDSSWVVKMSRKFSKTWLLENPNWKKDFCLTWKYEIYGDALEKYEELAIDSARHAIVMSL